MITTPFTVNGRFKTLSWWDSFHGASLDAVSVGGEAIFRAKKIRAACDRHGTLLILDEIPIGLDILDHSLTATAPDRAVRPSVSLGPRDGRESKRPRHGTRIIRTFRKDVIECPRVFDRHAPVEGHAPAGARFRAIMCVA